MADDIGPGAGNPALAEANVTGIEALIERWWEDHFPGSVVARYTEAWNVAFSAKEALKRLLKGSE
jgi:hypothetical protein